MKWSRHELLELFPSHSGDITTIGSVAEVFIDSRERVDHGLFVPICGEHFDGHDYLRQAIDHGAVATLWQIDRPFPDDVPQEFPFFLVEDTVAALQQMARYELTVSAPRVIAVTGSNGKTTTKDMLDGVLNKTFRTHKTKGNLNNHIGVPLTILAMPEGCEVLILEMGMNHFGEISLLSQIAEPDFAVITNIGESHIEFLGSRSGIAQAKMEITDGLKAGGQMVFDGDEPLLSQLNQRQPSLACGFTEGNDIRITAVEETSAGLRFCLNQENPCYEMPVLGDHNVKNAALAIAVARQLGVADVDIRQALQELAVTAMRFEQLAGKNGSLLINDAYNASPTSMQAAIEAVRALKGYRRKVLVLGDMHELGGDEQAYHEQVAVAIQPPITDVITIGSRARWIAEAVKGAIQVHSFAEKEAAVSQIEELLTADTVVLFKASRAVGLETLVGPLQR